MEPVAQATGHHAFALFLDHMGFHYQLIVFVIS